MSEEERDQLAQILRAGEVVDLDDPAAGLGDNGAVLWERIRVAARRALGGRDPGVPEITGAALSGGEALFGEVREAFVDRAAAKAAQRSIVAAFTELVDKQLALPIADRNGCVVAVETPGAGTVEVARVVSEAGEGGAALRWGLSPSLLLALAQVHGDDLGMVVPPRVAPVQALVVATEAGADAFTEELAAYLAGPALRVSHCGAGEAGDWRSLGIPVLLVAGVEEVEAEEVVVHTRVDDTILRWPKMGLKARLVDHLDALQLRLRHRAREVASA